MYATNAPPRKNYAILRFAKIRSWATLALVDAHNNRKGELPENVLADAPAPVELLGADGSDDFVASAARRLNEVGLSQADADKKILAIEAVVSASKAWFENALQSDKDEWVRANLAWAQAKFGRGLISAKLHLDEETWHIHFIALPLVEKARKRRGRKPKDPEKLKLREEFNADQPKVWTLSYEDMLGGHNSRLSLEQDVYHAAVAHLCLERGEKNPDVTEIHLGNELYLQLADWQRQQVDGQQRPRKSITSQEYRKEIKRLLSEADNARARADDLERDADQRVRRTDQQRQRLAERLRWLKARQKASAERARNDAIADAAVAADTMFEAVRQKEIEAQERLQGKEDELRRRQAGVEAAEERASAAERAANKTLADAEQAQRAAVDARLAAEADAAATVNDRAAAAEAMADAVADRADAAAQHQAAQADREAAGRDRAAASNAAQAAVMTDRQLALVDRASADEALQLMLADSPRGVSMNEAPMTLSEREAYRAPWSAVARSVARAVAQALARARDAITAALAEAKRHRDEAARERQRHFEEMDGEWRKLNIAKITQDKDRAKAKDFMAAWEAIPEAERAPPVKAALAKAGILAQAARMAATDPAQAKGVRVSDATDLGSPRGPGRER